MTTLSKTASISFNSLIPKGEFIRLSGAPVGASGTISIAQQISRYIRPERSKGVSTFPPSKTNGSQREYFKIDKVLLNEAREWNFEGK